MESLHGAAEVLRLPSHLVERDQPVVDVESSVLEPLRHHRPERLLQLEREGVLGGALALLHVGCELLQEDAGDEIVDARVLGRIAPLGAGHRVEDVVSVPIVDVAGLLDVGAVHREAGDHLDQGRAQRVEREVARPPVAFRDAVELPGEQVHLRRHRRVEDELLLLIDQLAEIDLAMDEPGVDLLQLLRVLPGDEDPVQRVEEVVAGGARHRPARRQRFRPPEDLLGDHVERPLEPRIARLLQLLANLGLQLLPADAPLLRPRPRALQDVRLLQQPEIAPRIREPVRMIDPQAVHPALRQQTQRQPVGVLEDLGVLHLHGGERIDVEEAAVVDLLR